MIQHNPTCLLIQPATIITKVDNTSKTAAPTQIYTVTENWTAELGCGLDEHPMETQIIGVFTNEDAANDTAADYAVHAFPIMRKSWKKASIGWKMPKRRLDITIDWGYTTNIVVGVEYLFEKSLEHKKNMHCLSGVSLLISTEPRNTRIEAAVRGSL